LLEQIQTAEGQWTRPAKAAVKPTGNPEMGKIPSNVAMQKCCLFLEMWTCLLAKSTMAAVKFIPYACTSSWYCTYQSCNNPKNRDTTWKEKPEGTFHSFSGLRDPALCHNLKQVLPLKAHGLERLRASAWYQLQCWDPTSQYSLPLSACECGKTSFSGLLLQLIFWGKQQRQTEGNEHGKL